MVHNGHSKPLCQGAQVPLDLPVRLVSSEPTPSCRLDYLTASFKFPNEEAEEDLFAYFFDLAEKVLPTDKPLEPTKGKYFNFLYKHPTGASFEYSPRQSAKSTAGGGLLTLPGVMFSSLDAEERRDLIVDIYKWPGFYRCTRCDPQLTVLDPPVTVRDIVDDVEAGRLWVTKFSNQTSYVERDSNGLIINEPTQYFGSPQSQVRLRIYDHGAKHGWQTPSLRVEVQARKETADAWFRRMGRRAYDERHAEPLLIKGEAQTVKDALNQHADFRDTSAYEGRPKPKKWAQSAPRPAWWDEMVGQEPDNMKIQTHLEIDLDRARDVCIDQYGRKLWLLMALSRLRKDQSFEDFWNSFALGCANKLRKDDGEVLAKLAGRPHMAEARRLFKHDTSLAAKVGEGEVPDPYAPPQN